MKKILLFLCGFFLLSSVNVMAVTLNFSNTDPYYVGIINPDSPASESEEVSYINYLIDLEVNVKIGPNSDGQTYARSSKVMTDAPDAFVDGSYRKNFPDENKDGFYTLDATGYMYVLGKYDGQNDGAHVWYLGENFIGSIEIPFGGVLYPKDHGNGYNQYGLSHISLYNPSPVPEPTTMLLLGSGLIGLAGFGRKKFKK
jgi:hypothetical protein